MAKPIKIWDGSQWVDVAINVPSITGHDEDTTNIHGITDTANLVYTSDLSAKAPLDSPTFTGTPSAPTAAAATNTTQIATTAFVRTEISNLVASAPAALDTLDELANALGDDASFATTVTNSLSEKAPLASPTFTGTVTVPTPANATDAATKGYVDTATAGAGGYARSFLMGGL